MPYGKNFAQEALSTFEEMKEVCLQCCEKGEYDERKES